MKISKALLASLLMGGMACAMTAKVKEPTLVEGTSVGKYQKPGAPVQIRYSSEHVAVGEESQVHIILTDTPSSGTMKVKLKVDKRLESPIKVDKHLSFDLTSGHKEYPIDLRVIGDEDGLYYIRLLVSIKGRGMRAFAVPVYIGDAKTKTMHKPVLQTSKGEKITVSPAEETVKR